jgi:hypothetical protein
MFSLCFRDSIVVSISACHADDPGSIPGRGAFFQLPSKITYRNCTFYSLTTGSWCSGITSALHAEGPGFKSRRIHFLCTSPRQRSNYHKCCCGNLTHDLAHPKGESYHQTKQPHRAHDYNSVLKDRSSIHSVVVCGH